MPALTSCHCACHLRVPLIGGLKLCKPQEWGKVHPKLVPLEGVVDCIRNVEEGRALGW